MSLRYRRAQLVACKYGLCGSNIGKPDIRNWEEQPMKAKLRKYVFAALILMFLASGCGTNETPECSLTITFKGNKCTYNGVKSVAAGEVSFTMVDKNQDLDVAMIVLTLDEGKTIDDLNALPPNTGEDPKWSHRVGEADRHVRPGERYTFKATIETGPIYLVCFSGSPELITGVLGPFEVTK